MSTIPIDAPISVLVDLIRENAKPGIQVAEVGCWKGRTTKEYVDIIKNNNGCLYLVDWFCGTQGINVDHEHCFLPEQKDHILEILKNNVKGLDCVHILEGSSRDMVSRIPDRSLDICFIDADHHHQEVKNDIYSYYVKVKRGGILCGHDCGIVGAADPTAGVFDLVNKFSRSQLDQEYVQLTPVTGCHPGVIQAVGEIFGGENVELRADPNGCGVPIWIYRM